MRKMVLTAAFVSLMMMTSAMSAYAWGPNDLRRVYLTCESICRLSLLCCRLAQNPRTLIG